MRKVLLTNVQIAAAVTLACVLMLRPVPAFECVSVGSREDQYRARVSQGGLIIRGQVSKLESLPNSNAVVVELRVIRVLSGNWTQKTLIAYSGHRNAIYVGYDFRIGQEYVVFPGQLRDIHPSVRQSLLSSPEDGLWIGGYCGGYTLSLSEPQDIDMVRVIERWLAARARRR